MFFAGRLIFFQEYFLREKHGRALHGNNKYAGKADGARQRTAGLAVERNWIKYGLAALAIHAGVLALPVSERVHRTAEQRVIDVQVVRQEAPQPSPLREAKKPKPLTRRLIARQAAPRLAPQVPPAPVPKSAERKDEPPSSGRGNVVDEQIVSRAEPGPAGGEGVAIAGVNAGGGKAGAGSGGTGIGSGAGGKGSGAGTGGAGGPVDARFGDADGPQFIYQERPEYPFEDVRLQREGKVVVRLTIDEKGKLQKVDVVEATDQTFAESAVKALKRSKFRPARRKGVPVACRAPYAIRFGF
jgi:protein TonB